MQHAEQRRETIAAVRLISSEIATMGSTLEALNQFPGRVASDDELELFAERPVWTQYRKTLARYPSAPWDALDQVLENLAPVRSVIQHPDERTRRRQRFLEGVIADLRYAHSELQASIMPWRLRFVIRLLLRLRRRRELQDRGDLRKLAADALDRGYEGPGMGGG